MSLADLLANLLRTLSGRPKVKPAPLPIPPAPRPQPIPQPDPPPGDPTSAAALFLAINAARAANGVPALANDKLVAQIAQLWAADMARAGTLDHGNFSGRITGVRPGVAAGEDIGMGYPSGAAEVQGWLSDAAHRAILLSRAYSSVGCGVARGSGGTLYYVADFVS